MTPNGPTTDDVHAKALQINLDPTIYGTFAEIGAGQEVARWFLRVGAASGTVAQTISAYDKNVSDERYGGATRYVSRERLLAMLDREFDLLRGRLHADRGATTRFFVFADTVAARNYRGDNYQNGWVGIRFQPEPGAEPSDVLLHVNLMDPTHQLQQEALGVLGVNLLHAGYFRRESCDAFLSGVFTDLSVRRIEVDVVELRGPAFAGEDERTWSLQALRKGMCHAVAFDRSARVVEPASVLRKRPLIVERGRFAALRPFHDEMLRAAEGRLRGEGVTLGRDPTPVLEVTIHHASDASSDAQTSGDAEVLARVGRMTALAPAVVSGFAQTYLLVEYFRRFTAEPLRLVLGVSALAQLMQREFYQVLPGNLLEGLGKLLAANVKIYAYPMPADAYESALAASPHGPIRCEPSSGVVTAECLRPGEPLIHLYRYLLEAGWVLPVES